MAAREKHHSLTTGFPSKPSQVEKPDHAQTHDNGPTLESPLNRFLLNALAILVLGTALLVLAPPSQAQTKPASQIEIAFDPTDLVDPAGLDTLRVRIEQAARDVCREALLGDLLRPVTMRSCIRDTTERAMSQLADRRATVLAAAETAPAEQP